MTTIEMLGNVALGFVIGQVFFWLGYAVGLGLFRKDKHD